MYMYVYVYLSVYLSMTSLFKNTERFIINNFHLIQFTFNAKQTVATKVITTFLAIIVTLNNFIFNSTNYLQTKACAMGTICAPSYANIFMDHFEKKLIYPLIKYL